jgi:2-keto-4-pentenoate hydratase/2-oxohepta-3-ene-1,7-dioic acid hydratase in catechol pathway
MLDTPFRLVTYSDAAGNLHPGLAIGGSTVSVGAAAYSLRARYLVDALATSSPLMPDLQALLMDWEASFEALVDLVAFVVEEGVEDERWRAGVTLKVGETRLRAPVPRPQKMLYAAANYHEHLEEDAAKWDKAGMKGFAGVDKSTARPYSFVKLPSCVAGPYDPIPFPTQHHRLDWEVELALVIGRRGKDIPAERAMGHVAGFTVANDLSLRDMNVREDWPFLRSDWFASKNFDGSAPLGPYLVPRDLVPDHMALRMTLKVNGDTKQNSITGRMTFTPEEQIEFVSSFVTLEPGDVLAMGTPAGAGFRTGEYLKPGDVVEADVEGLGCQRNEVVSLAEPDGGRDERSASGASRTET